MIYLAYNENLEITNAQMFETENTIPFVEHNFIKPKIDLETMELYEGATVQEIAEFNKPIIPQIVTNAQFRLALIESGQSISNINAFINSKEEPIRDVLNSLWEYANHFERQNPQLIQMATLLGLTSEKLDNLFILANTK